MIKKMISVFLLLFLAARPAIAQNTDEKFTEIVKGEPSPYDGFVFTKPAVAKIYTNVDLREKQTKLAYEAKLSELNLQLSKLRELNSIEIEKKDKLFDLTIREKNATIAKLSSEAKTTQIITISSFFIGSILGGFIIYKLTSD